MTTYIASVRDKETKELQLITKEYERKSDFYEDLRMNGYSVRFITTPEKFDEDCEKYAEKCKKSSIYHKVTYKANKLFK